MKYKSPISIPILTLFSITILVPSVITNADTDYPNTYVVAFYPANPPSSYTSFSTIFDALPFINTEGYNYPGLVISAFQYDKNSIYYGKTLVGYWLTAVGYQEGITTTKYQ